MRCATIPSHIQTPTTNLLVNTVVVTHNGQAIIFDPAAPLEKIMEATNHCQVVAVLLTHGHWDHVFSLLACLNHFHCPCYMHPNAINKLHNPIANGASSHHLTFALDPNELTTIQFLPKASHATQNQFSPIPLEVGKFALHYVYTPGHSDCSVTYLINHNIVCGDVLRMGKLARTDLPTANLNSLHASLAYFRSLPQTHTVYNGHDTAAPLSAFMLNTSNSML